MQSDISKDKTREGGVGEAGAKAPLGLMGLGNLYRKRELLWQFTIRNVNLRHKGSYLGIFWSVLNPLLMLGLYTFVFGIIFGGRFKHVEGSTSLDFALGIFIGLTIFGLISETLFMAPHSILGNPNFIKKIVFPLEILPAASVLASVYHFFISLLLCLIGIVIWGPGLDWHCLWFPVIIFPLMLISLGLSWMISALGVFFRDLIPLTQFVSTVLFYMSGIFFSASMVPEGIWPLLRINPLIHAIGLGRDVLLWKQTPEFGPLLYIYLAGFAILFLGNRIFTRLKPGFADVV